MNSKKKSNHKKGEKWVQEVLAKQGNHKKRGGRKWWVHHIDSTIVKKSIWGKLGGGKEKRLLKRGGILKHSNPTTLKRGWSVALWEAAFGKKRKWGHQRNKILINAKPKKGRINSVPEKSKTERKKEGFCKGTRF